jgi:tRNA (guanine-N7-)-methyltransferase
MFANSREVSSSQVAAHPRLDEIVARHLREPFRREPSALGRHAFASVVARLARAPFILDAGCGTGASTLALAREFPQDLVLGVDKSAARLAVGQRQLVLGESHTNVILLHCELVDFWQLAAATGLRCRRQFLLYPNPWPKPEHLLRRWHAHPVLPALLALGGRIELRSNWQVYAAEFACALQIAGAATEIDSFVAEHALTPFERKYAASGHSLWRVRTQAEVLIPNRMPDDPRVDPMAATAQSFRR